MLMRLAYCKLYSASISRVIGVKISLGVYR